jgi:hypothetical protein
MSEGSDPAWRAGAVTKSDTTVVAARALYIGGTGDVAVVPKGQTDAVTFKAVPVGFFPVSVSKVMSTNTTATDIIALY